MLMILPTLGCNFKCWYCIQDHTASKMSPSTIDAVKRHIDYAISEWGIKHLGLSWFGGEPLIYFKDVVEPISKYAKEVCEKKSVGFGNNATTNGYFLTKEVAQELTSLGFGNFQVTIDGNKETHDKVKFQKGCESAFERTLRNLNEALLLNDGVTLTLRINYSKDNLREGIVEEVNKYISPEVRNRVRFMARKVWQEPISDEIISKADQLALEFEDSGYGIELDDFNSGFMACYACKKFYNAISYNGDVFKCTAIPELNTGPAPGRLNPDGSISWSPYPEEYYRQKSFANPICDKCVYLPLCMGQCPRNFLQHGFVCKEPSRERSFEDSIVRFIDNLPPKSDA